MPKKFDRQKQDRKDFVRCNERIRIREVRVIHDGQNLGVMATADALKRARQANLDLVEVAPNSRPPVCQIMDYGKFMFEKSKKKKQPSSQKEKELSFRYVIGDHDLETKANLARKFLEKGQKVKFVVKFKAREKAHKNQGFSALEKMVELLNDIASVEKAPGFEGHNLTARLEPKKD
jgi:translation initiation factor IF-3